MKKKFYLTTAIAYPNSSPHLGHALEILQSDVVARFNRLLGKDVFFQTGTDEHGTKNFETAKKEGKDVKEFLDVNVAVFKKLFKKLNISYDQFIRTTDKKIHYPGAVKLWKELAKSGDIYKKKYRGLYCSGCEAFKTEKELEKGKCPNHPTREIETVEEENYFFKLSKYKDEISKRIKSDEYKVIPQVRKNEILSFLKTAKDISFSRPKATLPWGIPVPGDDEQIMYVWCDALSNYITGAGYGADEKKFKKIWPADVHIIGKDILRFHAAFWPAMLISAKVQLPKKLFVHGFILSRGAKMSKSEGNIIEPFEQIEKYGVEQFRFYMLGAMSLDGDGEYSEELVVERVNSELVGNLANFCYRVLSFTNKNFNSEIKGIDDNLVINKINKKIDEIKKAYEEYDFKRVIDGIMSISALGNKYFQDNEPWKLIKDDNNKAQKICGLCVNIAKNLSILISPILPEFSSELQKQMNLKDLKWKDLNFKLKTHIINESKISIRKIEIKEEEEFPLNLKVGKIIKAKEHPDADKLVVLDIELGREKRQLVAGLRKYYSNDELTGKNVIIVANLKYSKLRGIESQGMLLASEDDGVVGLLTVKNAKTGDSACFGNLKNSNKEISFDNFLKMKITAKDGKVFCNNKELKINNESVSIEKVKNGKVR
ncbi:methionine--tRNA ligase [Candidatus Woesearchaeota archaeon]|nr:methionine--tRNA ligase [Candidatus Woesearchaeota archaeon]